MEELKHKNDIEKAANLLSGLNIASEGKIAMNELEWTGKYNEIKNTDKIVQLDSDDEDDPLKILAQVSFIFSKISLYFMYIVLIFIDLSILAYRIWCS